MRLERPFGPLLLGSSPDAREVYEFDRRGKHQRTLSYLTGQELRHFDYDTQGRLTGVVEADGNRTIIERDPSGTPTAIVAPFGQRTTLQTDANSFLARAQLDAHPPHQFEYDPSGLMTAQVDPRASRHTYEHDGFGRVTRDIDPAGGSHTFSVANANGVFTATKTTALGQVTTYDWRSSRDGTSTFSVKLPTGHTNLRQLAVDGTATTTMIDGTTVRVVHQADATFGLFAPLETQTITAPNGTVRTLTQSRSRTAGAGGIATLTETLNDNNRISTRNFVAATRMWTMTSAEARVTHTVLDPLARVVSSDSTGVIPRTLHYDGRGRVDRVAQGATRFRDFVFDSNSGYLANTTNALAQTTSHATDSLGRVTMLTAADNGVIELAYDGESHLTSVTPPARPAHQFGYSPVDLLQDYTAPMVGAAATTTHSQYDLDRRPISVTQPDGLQQTFTYSPTTGQLVTATVPGAGTSTFAYDTRDRLASVTRPTAGSVTFGYNGDMVTSMTIAGPHSVSNGAMTVWSGSLPGAVLLGYDATFNVKSVDVRGASGAPNGFAAQYTRDRDDLITAVTPLNTGTGVPTLTLTRSPLDGHVTATSQGVVTTTQDTDANTTTPGYGELRALGAKVSGADVFTQQYQRDALGRIQRVDEVVQGSASTRQYEYDSVGRLSRVRDAAGVLVGEYDYDANGARTRVRTPTQQVDLGVNLGCGAGLAQPVDAQDRLCRYGDNNYAYNANGQLATKTQATTGAVATYTYDGAGRLKSIVNAEHRIDYAHDAIGRRIGKAVDGMLRKGWIYQGTLGPVAQLNSSGQIEATFVYATRVNVPEYMVVRATGQVFRLVTDQRGSVRLLVNVPDGSVGQRIDYDEFGNVLADTNPGFQPFGFAGGLYDADTGLVRFGARDYDAATGRWTVKDPIGFAGGDTNLYAYVENDPINFVDPSGLLRLPPDPSGLGSDWVRDPSHKDPNGERFRHPSGDVLDFHNGRPGLPGWRGKDHWHHNGGDEHLKPGDEVDDPAPICSESRSMPNPSDSWFESNYGLENTVPLFPLPFFGPLPSIPFPMPAPMPVPAL